MITPVAGGQPSPDQQLREAAKALEGVFIAQLHRAMRESVPDGGLLESSAGQETFTQMFDDQMAQGLAQQLRGSIGDLLYEQLRDAIGAQRG